MSPFGTQAPLLHFERDKGRVWVSLGKALHLEVELVGLIICIGEIRIVRYQKKFLDVLTLFILMHSRGVGFDIVGFLLRRVAFLPPPFSS